MNTEVKFSTSSKIQILVTSVESFKFGTGDTDTRDPDWDSNLIIESEISGLVFGQENIKKNGDRTILIENVIWSVSSNRDHQSVTDNESFCDLAIRANDLFSPELKMIGHIHTHPYTSYTKKQIIADKLYSRSRADAVLMKNFNASHNMIENPIFFISTIIENKKIKDSYGEELIADNVILYNAGQCSLFLYCCQRIDHKKTPLDERGVFLNYNGGHFNSSEARLYDV